MKKHPISYRKKQWEGMNQVWVLCVGIAGVLLSGCTGAEEYRISDQQREQLVLEIETERMIEIKSTRVEVARAYENFLRHFGDRNPTFKAVALKRLGDLYLDMANQQYLQGMKLYETKPEGPPPVVNYSKAIEIYEKVLKLEPGETENDQVLYSLARAYGEMGEGKEAFRYLNQLKMYNPESQHQQEVNFRIGEFYFSNGQYEMAAKSYKDVLSRQDLFLKAKARYKLGWSYFELNEHERAIGAFFPLVQEKQSSLYWEAMTYLALSFQALGGPTFMSTYFKDNGHEAFEKDLYLMVGNQYFAHGKKELAVETYQTFVNLHRMHPMAPIFSSYIIEVYKKQDNPMAHQDEIVQWVETYHSKSAWHKENDQESRLRARPMHKEFLYHLGVSAHNIAQTQEDKEGYRAAIRWYREFLEEFPEEDETGKVRFLMADAHYAVGDYSDAGQVYEAIAYGQENREEKRRAAYAALLAYEKVNSPAAGDQFVELAAFFADHFPQHEGVPTVLIKAGEQLYDQKRYQEARNFFGRMLTRYHDHEKYSTVQKWMAHSYMKDELYEEAERYYALVLSNPGIKKTAEQKELMELMASAIYKQGKRYQNNHQPRAAALHFQRVADEVPGSTIAAVTLFEAGEILESIEQPYEAIAAYQKLIHRYRYSDWVGQAWVRIGLIFESQGDRLKMAEAFEQAAQIVKETELKVRLLWTAASEYESASQWHKSFVVYNTFSQSFPDHPDTPEALLKTAMLQKKQGKTAEAWVLFERVEKRAPGTYQAGQAAFERAEAAFDELKSIHLVEPLDQNIKKKLDAMDQTVALYVHSAESQFFKVVTGSAHRLGEVFEHFRDALLKSEPPKELTQEQQEEYFFQLEEQAYPFEEKAVEAYETNIHRIRNAKEYYGEWVKKSYERLAELRPALYRRPERAERIISELDMSVMAPEDEPGTVLGMIGQKQ